MNAIAAVRPVITMWSAVSPFGLDRHSFVDGLRAGADVVSVLDADRWQSPDERACIVPGFEIRDVLGKKGTRSMDRVSAFAVTATGQLLQDAPLTCGNEDVGVVLGTTTGSVQSMMDFTRTSFTAEQPFYVDPAVIPNIVMNCAAGQCAIWHRLKGPNTTVAGGRGSALLALGYAARLLAAGRASTVLCGSAEEYSGARSWLEHRSQYGRDGSILLGEGAAMFAVQPADQADHAPLATILAVESMVYLEGDVRAVVTACVQRALRSANVSTQDVWAVVPGALPGLTGQHEREALDELFDEAARTRVPDVSRLGDASAATSAFQIASVLAVAEQTPGAAGQVAVVTTVDRDGTVACAVLRLAGDVDPGTGAVAHGVGLEELRQVLAETMDIDAEDIGPDKDFINDLGADSLMSMEVLAVLEKRYGVRFVEQEMRELRTLRAAHRLLDAKVTGR